MTTAHEPSAERWVEPDALLRWAEVVTTVRPGQVWRARWDDVVSLVLVDAVDQRAMNTVRVAPVTVGADDADDSAWILESTLSNFSTALTVWPSLVQSVAEVVLENLLTTFEQGFATLDQLEAAVADGSVLRGLPTLNDHSSRAHTKRRLAAVMEVFAHAVSVSSGDGSLEKLLAGLVVTQVSVTLDVPVSVAFKIIRGEQYIDWDQATRLAELVNMSPLRIFNSNPTLPEPLVKSLTALRRGPQIRAIANRARKLESEVLSEMAHASVSLAARGEKGDIDWNGRVDHYIRTALASA